jgi:hypothetical protein
MQTLLQPLPPLQLWQVQLQLAKLALKNLMMPWNSSTTGQLRVPACNSSLGSFAAQQG